MGGGRQSTRRVKAAKAGDLETANALKPPSERPMTEAEKCGALTQKGTPCQQRKGSRTDHPGYGNCIKHGGNTQAGVKKAMTEMAKDLANQYREDRRFGGDWRNDPELRNFTPEAALLEEVRRSAALVRFLEERISRWNLHPDSDGQRLEAIISRTRYDHTKESLKQDVTAFLDSLPRDDPSSGYHLPALSDINRQTGFVSFTDAHTWLSLYREERAHLARVSKMCIDADISQRLVTIAEDQGRVLATAIRAVLLALNLTPTQQALIPRVVPPILRAVATDSPIPDISSLIRAEDDSPLPLTS